MSDTTPLAKGPPSTQKAKSGQFCPFWLIDPPAGGSVGWGIPSRGGRAAMTRAQADWVFGLPALILLFLTLFGWSVIGHAVIDQPFEPGTMLVEVSP